MKRLFSWFYHFVMFKRTKDYNYLCYSLKEVNIGYVFCAKAKNHYGKHKSESGKRKWV